MSNLSEPNEHETISNLFRLLDKWRHLPAYKLEPRADVFFALFLPEVLGKHFGIDINPILIPEFPIKNRQDNTSKKVDYLALQKSPDGKSAQQAFLVELKTDMASRRDDQDEYLSDAVDAGLQELIKGVLEICLVTNQKDKYVHLLKLLSDVHLVEYDDDLFPVKQGYSKILKRIKDKVERRKEWPSLEVVYVQPKLTDAIDFNEFATTIEEIGGIGRLFAGYLKKWVAEDAGSPNPKTLRSC